MEIDVKPIVPCVCNLDVNFVDDDELQAALASSHQAKVKVKKISPEKIAQRSQFLVCVRDYIWSHHGQEGGS